MPAPMRSIKNQHYGAVAQIATIAFFAMCLAAPLTAWSADRCLSYGPRVNLAGKLIRQTFPGPPNYESVAKGDKPETGWYLELVTPICVDANPKTSDEAAQDVRKIELVVTSEQYRQYRKLIGQDVQVSGVLFHAFSGHHHTPVLLEKVQFEK